MYDELAKKINNIKTADTSNLSTKFNYHTKIAENEKNADNDLSNIYITTKEFNRLNFKVIINCSTHWTSAC